MEQILQLIDIIEKLFGAIAQFSASTWISLVRLTLFYFGIKPIFSEYTSAIKVPYISVGIVIIAIAQFIDNGYIAF